MPSAGKKRTIRLAIAANTPYYIGKEKTEGGEAAFEGAEAMYDYVHDNINDYEFLKSLGFSAKE